MSHPDYSVQATPFIIRDLGWDFIKELAFQVYPKFSNADFRPLIFGPKGTFCLDAFGEDTKIKVFYASLNEFTDSKSNRVLMISPYLDKDGIKVLYFKWADETLYDSFCVPDGQNRVWDNREQSCKTGLKPSKPLTNGTTRIRGVSESGTTESATSSVASRTNVPPDEKQRLAADGGSGG